jgi:hypothetical protein
MRVQEGNQFTIDDLYGFTAVHNHLSRSERSHTDNNQHSHIAALDLLDMLVRFVLEKPLLFHTIEGR